MPLSIDLLNGLFLFTLKALCVLATIHWLVEQSRGWSASVIHSLLVLAAVAVLLVPLATWYLPPLPLALVPQAMAQWLSMPVATQIGSELSYNMPLVLVVFIYLLTATWFLCDLVSGIIQVARISQGAQPADAAVQQLSVAIAQRLELARPPRIKVTREVSSPQMWGARRPVVLLPLISRDWTNARLRRVLTHELAHIKRGDWLLKMFLHSLAALVWFIPLIWGTLRRSAWYAELACDDWVVMLEGKRAEYAGDLLALAADFQRRLPGALALVNEPNLYLRIRAVLDGSRSRAPVTATARIKYGTLILILLLPLASLNAVVRPEAEPQVMPEYQPLFINFDPEYGDNPPPGTFNETGFSPEDLALLKQSSVTPAGLPEEVITVWRDSTDSPEPLQQPAPEPAITFAHQIAMQGPMPLVTRTPRYPPRALHQGLEGSVTVQFDVDLDGTVINPRIISAEPSPVFNRQVLSAIAQFHFRPQRIDGQTVITKDVTETFIFKLRAE